MVADRIEKLREEIENWRQVKPHRAARLPGEYWKEAASLAREAGAGAVSKALRLDHTKLKRLAGLDTPAFYELTPATSTRPLVCAVEAASPERSLRATISGASGTELGLLFKAFCG